MSKIEKHKDIIREWPFRSF